MADAKRLKILQVGSAFPNWGGTEIHMLQLSQGLVARGHSVTITCQAGSFVEREATKRGLPIETARVKRPHDFRNAGRILRLLQRGKFDVVHAHWFNDYLVTPLIARLCRVPVVIMSHHSPYPLKPFPGKHLYQKRLFNRIVALSESVRQNILTQGFDPAQVVTIHHGTDTEMFRHTTQPPADVRAAWGIPKDAFLAGMAGRIGEEKGIFPFLDALAQLKDHKVCAVLIGDGPKEAEARARAEALGLLAENRLVFAGFRSDINNAIGALDVLVLASTWAEPCAAVVQQAMALGKPVVGTSIGGTPEMIEHGVTGLLIPPGDAKSLADALIALSVDAPRRAAMGSAGRDRVERLFTLRGMIDKNEALYFEAASAYR